MEWKLVRRSVFLVCASLSVNACACVCVCVIFLRLFSDLIPFLLKLIHVSLEMPRRYPLYLFLSFYCLLIARVEQKSGGEIVTAHCGMYVFY